MRLRKPKHEPFIYKMVNLVKVIDGDTYDVDLDLGFNLMIRVRIRLIGIDTPEMKDPLGEPARLFAWEWFNTRTEQVIVKTSKSYLPDGVYGRWLGEVVCDGVLLSEELKKAGHIK